MVQTSSPGLSSGSAFRYSPRNTRKRRRTAADSPRLTSWTTADNGRTLIRLAKKSSSFRVPPCLGSCECRVRGLNFGVVFYAILASPRCEKAPWPGCLSGLWSSIRAEIASVRFRGSTQWDWSRPQAELRFQAILGGRSPRPPLAIVPGSLRIRGIFRKLAFGEICRDTFPRIPESYWLKNRNMPIK